MTADPRSESEAKTLTGSAYIVSPRYDAVFFILSPLIALGLAELIAPFSWPFERTRSLENVDTRVGFFHRIFHNRSFICGVFSQSRQPNDLLPPQSALYRGSYSALLVPTQLQVDPA